MSQNLLESIKTVTAAVLTQGPGAPRIISVAPIFQTSNSEVLLASMQQASLKVVANFQEVECPKTPLSHTFSTLGISRSEEPHSNAIAQCFKTTKNDFGNLLLAKLLEKYLPVHDAKSALLKVYRERRLGSLPWSRHLPSETQARRLDILIEHPDVVMAIENKIDSFESQSQTQDYYAALNAAYGSKRKIICLFLTPNGDQPECQYFKSMTYSDLFNALRAAIDLVGAEGCEFPLFYLGQLHEIFIKPIETMNRNTRDFWKGKSI